MVNVEQIFRCILAIMSVWGLLNFMDVFISKKSINISIKILTYIPFFLVQSFSIQLRLLSPFVLLSTNIFAIFLLVHVQFKGSISKKIILIIVFAGMWMIVELTISFFLSLLGIENEQELALQFGVLVSEIMLFVIVVLLRMLNRINREKEKGDNYWLLLLAIPFSSIYISYNIFILEKENHIKIIFSLISYIFLLCINMAVFLVYLKVQDDRKREKEDLMYKQQVLNMLKYYEEIEQMSMDMKKERHNLRNHFLCIKEMALNNRNDVIVKYLNDLENDIFQNIQICRTGNIVVDAMVNSKYSIIKRKGIKFEINIKIPEKLRVKDNDLCVILGNAIDNAIEAVEKVDGADKKIDIMMGIEKNSFLLIISNPFTGKLLTNKYGDLISTKSDKDIHGIGGYSIKKAVKKYDGDVVWEIHDSIFRLIIMIPV